VTFLVTGGCGFIGSNFARIALALGHEVIILDALTYAGHHSNLPAGCRFIRGNICNERDVEIAFRRCPDAVFNFAAESHVCRSIAEASQFIESNIRGTYVLLKETLHYWKSCGSPQDFRYVQISTDEVFGDLGPDDSPFTEESQFRPNSPYAASKAAADHLVRAWGHTYGLPVLTTHCSNNYGPRQHPEKLIPLTVTKMLRGEPITLHGTGKNVRDWLWVEDHCDGILAAYGWGTPGERYCFGGHSERTNLDVVTAIAHQLGCPHLIKFGPDRPGNDRRYAIDTSKAKAELGWEPKLEFGEGLARTVRWYAENWEWVSLMLGEELGEA